MGTDDTPANSFAGLTAPGAPAIDDAGSHVYVPDSANGHVLMYDLSGTSISLSQNAFSGLSAPFAGAYVHDIVWPYFADGNTILAYSNSGHLISTGPWTGLNNVGGIAYDTNDHALYVSSHNAGSNGVTAYDLFGHSKTLTGGFAAVNQPGALVFDPYNTHIYVVSGAATVAEYDEQGNVVTLPVGAFAGLTGPWGIAIVP
jgi:DNA-binding beta-propeller fold protein YncE